MDSEGYCRYENLPGHVLSVKGEVWKFENWTLAENFNDISDWSWTFVNWLFYTTPTVTTDSNVAREGNNFLAFRGVPYSNGYVTLSKTVPSGFYKVGIFIWTYDVPDPSYPMTCLVEILADGVVVGSRQISTGAWRLVEARLPSSYSTIGIRLSQFNPSNLDWGFRIDALLLGAKPTGNWTVGNNYFEDNNTGTHSVFWSGSNFTVENFSLGYVKRDGKVVLKFFLDNIDGIVENTYPYPDCPPYLLSNWISSVTPPLVDVDRDVPENQEYRTNDNFTWAIKCRDPDNDNLVITCRIYDNQGNLAFENSVRVWWDSTGYYRTFGDNRGDYEGWFVWNPADNSPFGTCDLWVRLDDNVLTFENTAWEVLYLDDITTTWSVSPANPFHRWEVTISGSVKLADFRPWFTSYLPGQNIWNLLGITSQILAKENIKYLRLDDQFSGTFYPTINAPWSQIYIEQATPSQIVQVSLSVICDLYPSNPKVWVLDGRPGWSYTNDSRWKYAVRLFWEKGFGALTDNEVENQYTYFVNFSYVGGGTSGDNRLVRQYTEFLLPYQIKWAVLKDNKNAYSRTLLDNGRRYLDFYLIQQQDIDAGKYLSYLFKIDDPQGQWRSGWARWYKWVQGQPKRAITEGYWGATGEIVVYLIYEETYNILLVSSENQELEYGFYVASANRIPAPLSPLIRAPLLFDPPTFWNPDYTLIFWYNWDNVDNSLHIYAQDKSGLTENIIAYLYPLKYASPASATNMMENQSGVFTTVFYASPENHWNIALELHHGENVRRVSYLIAAVLRAPSLSAPSGVGGMVGSPVLSAIFATAIALVFILIFGQINVGVGIMFSGIALLLIRLVGIAVPGWLVGLLIFFGILAILAERRM
jgi:hypothetical protein